MGGIPVSGGEHRIWLSDFAKMGMYDAGSETWSTVDLPWPQERLNGMLLQSVGDAALGVALVCERSCAEYDDAEPALRIVPFKAAGENGTVTVKEVGESSESMSDLSNYTLAGITSDSIEVLVLRAKGGLVTTVTPSGTDTTTFDNELGGLCRVGSGYVGLERVDVAAENAVPWRPLPEGWKANPGDAQRVVVGPSPGDLRSIPVPDAARSVLANWTSLANSCLPSAFALIGPDRAWEYAHGAWSEHPSTMREGVGNERTGSMVALGDGSLYGRAPSTALRRSIDGAWSSAPNDPVLVQLGESTLSYARPTVANSLDETGGGPSGGD